MQTELICLKRNLPKEPEWDQKNIYNDNTLTVTVKQYTLGLISEKEEN